MKLVVMSVKGGLVWMLGKTSDKKFLWKSWAVRNLMQRTKSTVFYLNTPLHVFFFESKFLIATFKLVLAEEYKFRSGARKKLRFFEISDCQDTDAKNTNRKFANRKPLYIESFYDTDPGRRGKDCSFGELWVWRSWKFKIEMIFFRKFRTIRILIQKRKTMIFKLKTRLRVLCF